MDGFKLIGVRRDHKAICTLQNWRVKQLLSPMRWKVQTIGIKDTACGINSATTSAGALWTCQCASVLEAEETGDQCPGDGKDWIFSKWSMLPSFPFYSVQAAVLLDGGTHIWWVFPPQFAGLHVNHLQTCPELCLSVLIY